jgi:hypothetical protein
MERTNFFDFPLMSALTLVSLLEDICGLKVPPRVATSENGRLHIHSLCI